MSRFVALATRSRSALPNLFDLVAFALIFGAFVAIVHGSRGMTLPLQAPQATAISLDYSNLPYYALRTTLRMFAAMFASLIFTFIYATWAAKSRRAERFLVPLLDVLQSVPILGFLSFTVTFFLGLFPGSMLGAECAAIFAIFTSQAWNMAFSFYQSLRTVPKELDEVAGSFLLSPWQKFWQLETPYAMPGLIWNMMVSMSGGWFFVVASEAISVGNTTVNLPGVGSYLAQAISQKRIDAVVAAIVTMLAVIIAYDQLLFRPLVTFGSRFRFELSASQEEERSWVILLFRRTKWLRALTVLPARAFGAVALWRLDLPIRGKLSPAAAEWKERLLDLVSIVIGLAAGIYTLWLLSHFIMTSLRLADIEQALWLTFLTLLRVLALILLASLVWVPVGILVGLQYPPCRARAAFDPIPRSVSGQRAVPDRRRGHRALLAQPGYLAELPHHLRHAMVHSVQCHRRREHVPQRSARGGGDLSRPGLGLVDQGDAAGRLPLLRHRRPDRLGRLMERRHRRGICQMGQRERCPRMASARILPRRPQAGDYPRIVLGVATMSIFVIVLNRFFWRPLSRFAERRLQLS